MKQIQIYDTNEPGFHPVVTYGAWKVAIFNDAEIWREDRISYLQKHNLSDEVFILLEGDCTLILCEDKIPQSMYAVKLEPGKIYNIAKGVWHSHVLEKNTKVVVVENSDTTQENSPRTAFPYPVHLDEMEYR